MQLWLLFHMSKMENEEHSRHQTLIRQTREYYPTCIDSPKIISEPSSWEWRWDIQSKAEALDKSHLCCGGPWKPQSQQISAVYSPYSVIFSLNYKKYSCICPDLPKICVLVSLVYQVRDPP